MAGWRRECPREVPLGERWASGPKFQHGGKQTQGKIGPLGGDSGWSGEEQRGSQATRQDSPVLSSWDLSGEFS